MSVVSDDQFFELKTRFQETASGVGTYGAYAILVLITTHTLIRQGLRNSRARQVLLVIVWLMFIDSTIIGMVYVSFFLMNIHVLQTTRPNPPTPADFDRLYIVLIVFTGVNFILSDGIVVWRAWVLYPRSIKIRGLLSLCMVGTIVATILNTIFSIKEVPVTHEERAGPGTLWFFLPLLATNLVATTLVAYKVWSYRKMWSELSVSKVTASGRSSVDRIMIVLVESGIIFCFYLIVCMLSALRLVGKLGHELLECILPPLEGIYLTLVILLVTCQRPPDSISPSIGFDEFSAIDFVSRDPTNDSPSAVQGQEHVTTPRIGESFVLRVKERPQWKSTASSAYSDIETGHAV
ncbi:hypothetical protein K435DRAFT_778346 [Dendrothele bispora CBS 962.96]|uniref:Uncharacterized protein n=1 Tax=Dendrothele bispora (strain CBS 962.96) TaxID=1314807 RepID=A0A4S8M3Y2_DENBC|nr:hypothetical protein K435DRAFT_778346 [Dendrothele bispora CBS 962.96]